MIIYLLLLLAFFLLIVFIKYWPFHINVQKMYVLKYHKLDLKKGETITLSTKEFEQELSALIKNGYDLSSLDELFNCMKNQTIFPQKAFVVLMQHDTSVTIKPLTLELIKQNVKIVFFRPVLLKGEEDEVIPERKRPFSNYAIHTYDELWAFKKIFKLSPNQLFIHYYYL